MKVEWFTANICNVPCMEVANHARSSNYTTPKTALFDGNITPKRRGSVIPRRDFSRRYV